MKKEDRLKYIIDDFRQWVLFGPYPPGSRLSKLRAEEPDPEAFFNDVGVLLADFTKDKFEEFKWLFEEWVATLSPEKQKLVASLLD